MENRNLTFKIIANTLVQSFGKFIAAGLSFINIALLTRYLGTEGYGSYTLVFSYLAFFSLIADFGLQFIGVKELAGEKENVNKFYGTYFTLKFYLVLISSFLALSALFFFPYGSQLKFAIVIGTIAVGFSGMTSYFNTVLQARVRLDLLTLVDVLGRFVSVITVVFFVFYKFNFYYIVSSVLIGNAASFAIGFLLLPGTIKKSFDKQIAVKLFRQSIPVGITALLSTLYFKIDTIILSVIKSPSDVGVYSLAYKILENIVLFWFYYVSTVYPLLASFKRHEEIKYKRLFRNSFLLAILVSIPAVAITYLLSPWVVLLFGGHQFSNSVVALRILLFSLPFILLNTLFYNFYILEEFNIVIVIGMIISLIFNVVLNVVYIPHYSYIAAAYITVFSEIILFLSYLVGLKFKNHEK